MNLEELKASLAPTNITRRSQPKQKHVNYSLQKGYDHGCPVAAPLSNSLKKSQV
jgi:hypothetical protein